MKTMLLQRLCPLCLLALLLSACETDSYDKGEGPYSNMLTDLADLHIDQQKKAVGFVTDDGDSYRLTEPITAQWIETADTTYRTLLYYNKVEGGKAELLQFGAIPTLRLHMADDVENPLQDPLGLESLWLAANRKYINLSLLLKNGRDEKGEEGLHKLGVVCDEIRLHADQTRTAHCRLLHSQNGAPQYYTNRRYVSILLPTDNRPDSLYLTIETYDGPVVKKIAL